MNSQTSNSSLLSDEHQSLISQTTTSFHSLQPQTFVDDIETISPRQLSISDLVALGLESKTETKRNHIQHFPKKSPLIIQPCPKSAKIHGIIDRYSTKMPSELHGKVSQDQYSITINKINRVLRKNLKKQAYLSTLGTIFCCFTGGISCLPAINLTKRTISKIQDILDSENESIYLDRLKLKFTFEPCTVGRFIEYNLIVSFIPRYNFTAVD